MPGLKLTKESVSQIVKPDSGQVDYFDALNSGFGVRATRDVLTFFVRRRLKGTTRKSLLSESAPLGSGPSHKRVKKRKDSSGVLIWGKIPS